MTTFPARSSCAAAEDQSSRNRDEGSDQNRLRKRAGLPTDAVPHPLTQVVLTDALPTR
jgi:hypothetical protein